MIFSGLFSVILGAIILWMFITQPENVLLASGWLLGINAFLSAMTYFFLGFKLKKTSENEVFIRQKIAHSPVANSD